MRAVQTSMLLFMAQPQQKFVIPVYQRTYKWTTLNCKRLLDDIIRASDIGNKVHFIGSIVYITDEYYQATKVNKLSIIDGQQRITTISLLLLAMCKHLKENPNKFNTTSGRLFNDYLINNNYRDEYDDDTIKLELTKHDKYIYSKLLKDDFVDIYNHNIYSNYKYFYETIKRKSLDIDKLFDGMGKLMIVDVSLVRSQDDPQLIFESLNSTGVKLIQSDLIRNYLLMDLEPSFQNKIYNDFWFEIESKLNENKEELSQFIRDYLTIKHEKIPNKSDVYNEFKRFFMRNYKRCEQDIERFVKELYVYSNLYEKIIKIKEENKDINIFLNKFNELDVKTINPLLLKIYYDYETKILNKEDFLYVLSLIESLIIRRLICTLPTNSFGKIVLNIIKNINKNNYVDSFEKILVSRNGNQRFPRDDEFKRDFLLKDVYNLKPSNRKFIINNLENFKSKEILNIDEFTIEHIMPQSTNLSEKWVKALGSDWKEIHNKYLHTIGNLSLTRYNREMGNKFFIEKRDIEGGYRDSSASLNKDLKDLNTWNEEEILKRANNLFSKAILIWKSPRIEEVEDKYNIILDFEDEWKNKKPKYFTFMDEHYNVKDITNLYIKVIELMYSFDPEVFLDSIYNEIIINKRMFSKNANDFHGSPSKLGETKLFINTNFSSDAKRNNLINLINIIGFSDDDFIIYL